MGTALAGNPDLLILDEPLTGLISAEVEEVMDRINYLHTRGLTVMIIEHNMRAVMGHCNRIVVMTFGPRSPKEHHKRSGKIRK
jgi:branched-chain amino acid transport system ATP-binding protein